MARSGIEPDIEDVLLLGEAVLAAAVGAGEPGGEEFLRCFLDPDVRSVFPDQRFDPVERLFGHDGFFARGAGENGQGDTPEPLAGEAPVRTDVNHRADAILSLMREPSRRGNLFLEGSSQIMVVNLQEPLPG